MMTNARYLRVRVKNAGYSAAKGCRVLVRSITKTDAAGTTTRITDDDWFDLSWAMVQSAMALHFPPLFHALLLVMQTSHSS